MEPKLIRVVNPSQLSFDDDEMSVVATISSNAIDRYNEVLLPEGVILDHYLKNPVLMWGHDYKRAPIGRAAWVKVAGKDIVSKGIFDKQDPLAVEIYGKYRRGFLRSFSVGFIPKAHRVPSEEDVEAHPEWKKVHRVYFKWDLLEYSAVPIPANPEALVQDQAEQELVAAFVRSIGAEVAYEVLASEIVSKSPAVNLELCLQQLASRVSKLEVEAQVKDLVAKKLLGLQQGTQLLSSKDLAILTSRIVAKVKGRMTAD